MVRAHAARAGHLPDMCCWFMVELLLQIMLLNLDHEDGSINLQVVAVCLLCSQAHDCSGVVSIHTTLQLNKEQLTLLHTW